jgi:hypothetical protein
MIKNASNFNIRFVREVHVLIYGYVICIYKNREAKSNAHSSLLYLSNLSIYSSEQKHAPAFLEESLPLSSNLKDEMQ